MDKCRKANLYQKMGYYNEYILCKFEESLKYYKKALKIDQELVHPSFIASSLNNIGVIYENWIIHMKL
ncbi:MAG: tetratricopeptide repeat protein [Rickettsia africae]